jgi:hypothetical protein
MDNVIVNTGKSQQQRSILVRSADYWHCAERATDWGRKTRRPKFWTAPTAVFVVVVVVGCQRDGNIQEERCGIIRATSTSSMLMFGFSYYTSVWTLMMSVTVLGRCVSVV